MGDSAGQYPQGFQFLCLEEFGLHLPFRRDIPEYQHRTDYPAFSIPDGRPAVGDTPLAAVPGDERGVVGQTDDQAVFHDLGHRIRAGLARAFVDDAENLVEGFALSLFLVPSRQHLRHPIDQDHFPLRVGGDDPIADAAQRHQQSLSLRSQLLQIVHPPESLRQHFGHLLQGGDILFGERLGLNAVDHQGAVRERHVDDRTRGVAEPPADVLPLPKRILLGEIPAIERHAALPNFDDLVPAHGR